MIFFFGKIEKKLEESLNATAEKLQEIYATVNKRVDDVNERVTKPGKDY